MMTYVCPSTSQALHAAVRRLVVHSAQRRVRDFGDVQSSWLATVAHRINSFVSAETVWAHCEFSGKPPAPERKRKRLEMSDTRGPANKPAHRTLGGGSRRACLHTSTWRCCQQKPINNNAERRVEYSSLESAPKLNWRELEAQPQKRRGIWRIRRVLRFGCKEGA